MKVKSDQRWSQEASRRSGQAGRQLEAEGGKNCLEAFVRGSAIKMLLDEKQEYGGGSSEHARWEKVPSRSGDMGCSRQYK